jgi:predicted nucleic acid-binding protein
MIVVDASLAAKWLFEEVDSDAAHAFLRRFSAQMCAPELIGTEVRAAMVRRANMGELTHGGARAALTAWRDILDTGSLQQIPGTAERLDASVELAVSIRHPLKDCLYLALAMELDCELATCDRPLIDKACAIHPKLRHLQDF